MQTDKKASTGNCVLVLANRLKKKDAPGKFYESSKQKKLFFNKDKIFLIKKRKNIDGIYYHWLKRTMN